MYQSVSKPQIWLLFVEVMDYAWFFVTSASFYWFCWKNMVIFVSTQWQNVNHKKHFRKNADLIYTLWFLIGHLCGLLHKLYTLSTDTYQRYVRAVLYYGESHPKCWEGWQYLYRRNVRWRIFLPLREEVMPNDLAKRDVADVLLIVGDVPSQYPFQPQ